MGASIIFSQFIAGLVFLRMFPGPVWSLSHGAELKTPFLAAANHDDRCTRAQVSGIFFYGVQGSWLAG
ncbi:MAG: hypothetical protein R3C04_10990 [Hyphomonas sp.]